MYLIKAPSQKMVKHVPVNSGFHFNRSKFLVVINLICGVFTLTVGAMSDFDTNPVVSTALGKIKGSVMTSRLDRPFNSFRGIRYGKPPVGDLRFRSPVPVEAWSDVFDATADGPMCVQYRPDNDYSDISEDCLRLNVYSHNPNITSKPRPVLVFIHASGFYKYSATSKYVGPQYLMDRDLVLVTMNYRLGSLGMLAAGTKEYPGNAAFKDQVLVLKWVNNNIACFGGDPNMVTLMGYSVGSMSVTMHMVSPMSQGLFHNVIAMSGAATSQWKVPPHQVHWIEKEARILNCSATSVELMIDCMKTCNATDIGKSFQHMFEFGEEHPSLLWLPVVEPDFGQERFMTDDPTRLFLLGNFSRVPVMAGITELEFAFFGISIMEQSNLRLEMDINFNEKAPICFVYERDTERSTFISENLREAFLNYPLINNRSIGLEHLFADSIIGFGVHRFVQLASRFTRVYYYKNCYVGRYSILYYPNDKPLGTMHTDDLLYLFVTPVADSMFKVTDRESLQVERMTRIMTNFATTGDPNNHSDNILSSMSWKPMITNRLNYLNIGDRFEMRDYLFIDRYSIWDTLFPLFQFSEDEYEM